MPTEIVNVYIGTRTISTTFEESIDNDTNEVTVNARSGMVKIPAGFSDLTVTNSYVNLNTCLSVLLDHTNGAATLTQILRVRVYDGYFIISGNATATNSVYIRFAIVS